MKVAITQLLVPRENTLRDNHAVQRNMIGDLSRQGAQLIILPECASHPYGLESRADIDGWAEELDGATVRFWEALAGKSKIYIVGGILERSSQGFFNTAVLIGPNGYLGHYRKMHRFGWEQDWLSSGESLKVWHIKSLELTLGLLICYDLRFSYMVSGLALAGVELIAVPTTWTSVGKTRLFDDLGYAPADHLVLGHAYAHRLFIAASGRVGQEVGVRYLGSSIVAGPNGMAMAGPLSIERPASAVVDMVVSQARMKGIGTNQLDHDWQWVPDIPVEMYEVE